MLGHQRPGTISPSRRDLLRAGAASAFAAATAAPAFAALNYRKPVGWDDLVRAAHQDGALMIYTPEGDEYEAALVTRFQRAYPGIRVQSATNSGGAQARLFAERSAGRYIPDIWVTGSTIALLRLKPIGALATLDPFIMLPEILDRSAWFQNALWWNDLERPLTNISFAGLVTPAFFVNTSLVKPSEFRSYWDFTDPKWKGKIASTDIRNIGPGSVPASFIYKNAKLGQSWFERFFGTLDVVLSRSQRQLTDWCVQGQYPIAAFISATEVFAATNQGLPIAGVPLDQLKEGGALGPNTGTVSVIKPTPHPNAAKLYVNWLLSREGQLAWQEETKQSSLRMDTPKDGLFLAPKKTAGITYANGGAQQYGVAAAALGDVITGILKKAGRPV
jgi:iron(III) transport system substrate-binding protein